MRIFTMLTQRDSIRRVYKQKVRSGKYILLVHAHKRSAAQAFEADNTVDSQGSRKPNITKRYEKSIPIVTFGLGTWQIQRKVWKSNLIEELQKKTNISPIDLPEDLSRISDFEYRRVKVKGKFDHTKEVFIGPRSLVSEGGHYVGSKFETVPESGNFIVTPFHLSDRDITILVNRGWVPRNKTLPEKRHQGQVDGEISLVGTVRCNEEKPIFAVKHDPSTNCFYFRDIERIAKRCNTALVFIDADSSSSVPGGPVGGQTRLSLRDQHISYVLTWYGLSAASAFMWYQRYCRGKVIK